MSRVAEPLARLHGTASAKPIVSVANAAEQIAASSPERPHVDKARLHAFIKARTPGLAPVSVSDLVYVEDAGGSNGIAMFETRLGGEVEKFVLRYAPGEQLLKQKRFDDEFLTLRALGTHDIPAPAARWCDPTGEAIGFPFLVMERLEGRAPANRMMYASGLLAEVTPPVRKSMLLEAAGFHGRLRKAALGPTEVPHLLERGIGATAIERELNWWLREAELVTDPKDPRRLYLAELTQWMIEHQPEVRSATLCHGDGQIANLMYRDGKLVAGLDWELSYLGHNEADLALVAMLVPLHVPPGDFIEGLPSEAELIERYEWEASAKVEHWTFFKLFNLVKVSTIMLMSGRQLGDDMSNALWALNASDRENAWAAAREEATLREGAPV